MKQLLNTLFAQNQEMRCVLAQGCVFAGTGENSICERVHSITHG